MTGQSSAALTIAHAIRWVKESLRPAFLSARRRASSVVTGTVRKLVAVGIERLSFMKRTSVAAGPRIGRVSPSAGAEGAAARSVALDRVLHVVLGHPPARARPAQRAQVHAVRAGHAGGDGRGVDIAVALGGLGVGGRLDLLDLGRGLHRSVALGGAGSGLDPAQDGADVDGGVGLHEQLGDRARHRRGDLGVDLVGGDLDERVVDGDGVAHGHSPFEDGALGDGVPHLGEGDVDDLAAGPRRAAQRTARRERRPARSHPSTAPTSTV